VRPLKIQFFLSYGIIGSITPLLAVFLKDVKGLNEVQIGVAMSMVSASTLLSPSLMTLLADTRLETRHILASAFGATALVLAAMLMPGGPALTLALMALYGLSVVAIFPLQDGLFFSAARAREVAGQTAAAYPSVRVWGTTGFILPAIVLWPLVRMSGDARPAVAGAAVYSVVCAVTALRALPRVPGSVSGEIAARRLPTADALRVLAAPQTRFLCAGLVLASTASVTYHYFFPIYLTDQLGIAPQWVPVIINLGVVFEIFYTLGYARLQRVLGVKGIIVGGLLCMTIRLGLLSKFPSLWVALAVQVGHGLEILALFVTPVILLNRLAGDHFRNSMQGAFSMMMGASRLVGSLAAGWLVQKNIFMACQTASLVGAIAVLIIVTLFRVPAETPLGRRESA
jgi:PPP family 3-phenylpropionic acid transporter